MVMPTLEVIRFKYILTYQNKSFSVLSLGYYNNIPTFLKIEHTVEKRTEIEGDSQIKNRNELAIPGKAVSLPDPIYNLSRKKQRIKREKK